MIRILRAFAWMRWRVLLNSLERTSARDTLERMSLAVDQLGPIIAGIILVPSLLGLSVLSAFAGARLAAGSGVAVTFEVLRYLMLGVSGLAVAGPILLPVMERANPVRLLLLPIPRGTLYLAQASSAMTDPWTLGTLPVILFLPLGLAVGGAPQAAAMALGAGLFLLLVIVGLSTLTSCLAQLVLRDRRRGELVGLAFILIIPLIGMLTSLLDHGGSRQGGSRGPGRQERTVSVTGAIARQAFFLLPSEQYVRAARAGTQGGPATGAAAIGVLAITAVALHGAGLLSFGRLLASPGSVSRRRVSRRGRQPGLRIPGLSPGAGAVAAAQVRLALRTPRGRSTLLSPLVVFVILAVVSMRAGVNDMDMLPQSGIGVAALSGFIAVLSVLPLAMNQFAIDGAGLTLELLSPISDDALLTGKTVANGIIGGVPALLCVVAAALLFPGGSLALWISVPIGLMSTYLLVAPTAALGSILFPRVVDLNSVGRGSNAHALAGLMGLAGCVLAAAPPLLLALLATTWLDRPGLAPVFLTLWSGIALAVHLLLFRPLRALLARRRENLSLVAG